MVPIAQKMEHNITRIANMHIIKDAKEWQNVQTKMQLHPW
jgi:hypothetical protein